MKKLRERLKIVDVFCWSVLMRKFYGSIVITKPGVKVITIEPSQDALSMESVVKLFSTAC